MLNRIFCIDDDPITLMLCKKVIAKTTFTQEIMTAQNGEEALDYFNKLKLTGNGGQQTNHPQLIFLDLNMPVMGGWEFLDNFSSDAFKEFQDIKVVVLSSTIDPEDLEKSKTYPMVIDFLPKPISIDMLDYLKSRI